MFQFGLNGIRWFNSTADSSLSHAPIYQNHSRFIKRSSSSLQSLNAGSQVMSVAHSIRCATGQKKPSSCHTVPAELLLHASWKPNKLLTYRHQRRCLQSKTFDPLQPQTSICVVQVAMLPSLWVVLEHIINSPCSSHTPVYSTMYYVIEWHAKSGWLLYIFIFKMF